MVGVDRSPDFVALARATAAAEGLPVRFDETDVRDLDFAAEFDAAVCLCQGGFGLLGGHDEEAVFGRIVAALRPGGMLALTAFHAAFALRHLEAHETFDPVVGVLHEVATLRDPAGTEAPFDLWTTCFTVRELRCLARDAGLAVRGVHGVAPGAYGSAGPTLGHPELLLVGQRT